MKRKQLVSLLLIGILVSFLGFWVENIFISFTLSRIDNRNMYLPFLLGYGLGIWAIFGLFGTPQNMRLLGWRVPVKHGVLRTGLYFLIACSCVTVGEITLGTFVEKVCGIVWWEYSTLPLNITKFASLPTSLGFGALITLFMGCIFAPLHKRLCRMKKKWPEAVAWVLTALLVADFLHSAYLMYTTGGFVHVWEIHF